MINYQQLIPLANEVQLMPKDKTATNLKIIRCMKEEFLTYGYEKASLNRISANVGITTAGLYKHFKGKDDMFHYLVKDTLETFEAMKNDGSESMTGDVADFDPFGEEWTKAMIDTIFSHYDGMRLLICCSGGSPYESFEEDLIDTETQANKQYAEILKKAGRNVRKLTEMEWHILSTEYIHLVFEIVRHGLTKEEAYRHIDFVKALLYPGWKEIFGM